MRASRADLCRAASARSNGPARAFLFRDLAAFLPAVTVPGLTRWAAWAVRSPLGGGGGWLEEDPAGADCGRGFAGAVAELGKDRGRGAASDLDAIRA